MKKDGTSNKMVVSRKTALATLFVGGIISFICLCIYAVNELMHELQPTPEQIAFRTWVESFDAEINLCGNRHWYEAVEFYPSAQIKRITDGEVRTYFSNVQIKTLSFYGGYDISVQGVVSLLDNACMEEFFYLYRVDGKWAEVCFEIKPKFARKFIQKELLRLADNPKNDFQTLMFPEEKFDLKDFWLNDDSE